MACEKFKEMMECVNTELNKTIKQYEDIKNGYLVYEPWINALNDNIPEGDFFPTLTEGSWLYVEFPFQSFCENFGINMRIQLRSGENGPIASYQDSSCLISFPSKSRINKFTVKRTHPNLVKYYDLILTESVDKDDMFYVFKTFTNPESLIKYLKIIKESVKNDNYALLKAYFDNERTEKALREITEC
jgi:hypothetical protein